MNRLRLETAAMTQCRHEGSDLLSQAVLQVLALVGATGRPAPLGPMGPDPMGPGPIGPGPMGRMFAVGE